MIVHQLPLMMQRRVCSLIPGCTLCPLFIVVGKAKKQTRDRVTCRALLLIYLTLTSCQNEAFTPKKKVRSKVSYRAGSVLACVDTESETGGFLSARLLIPAKKVQFLVNW